MKVKSIQCKQCGAPLKLYGAGHRIRSLNCEYCGAVMDARKDYALLYQFKDQRPPTECPLSIGMQGTIHDVSFVIIGMVSYRSSFGDRWTDLHLFSETHGYAWLTYQWGHFTFTRRVRYLPDRDMRKLTPKSTVHIQGKPYLFFETYQSEITYVAGELTWLAKVGETSLIRDAINPPFMFTMEETEQEYEFYLTEYIEPEVIHKNFKLEQPVQQRTSIHPAQPFSAPIRRALSCVSLIFLLVSLALIVGISIFGQGSTVLNQWPTTLKSGPNRYPFEIDNTRHMTEIRFENPNANTWQISDITLFDEKKPVFTFGDQLSPGNGRLKEQSGRALFKLDKPGHYTLQVNAMRTQNTTGNSRSGTFYLRVRQGVLNARYFKYLFFLSLIGYVAYYVSRYFFTSKRWASSY